MDVTIHLDTLVVNLREADLPAGRLDQLGAAIVAALRAEPQATGWIPADAVISLSCSDPGPSR